MEGAAVFRLWPRPAEFTKKLLAGSPRLRSREESEVARRCSFSCKADDDTLTHKVKDALRTNLIGDTPLVKVMQLDTACASRPQEAAAFEHGALVYGVQSKSIRT